VRGKCPLCQTNIHPPESPTHFGLSNSFLLAHAEDDQRTEAQKKQDENVALKLRNSWAKPTKMSSQKDSDHWHDKDMIRDISPPKTTPDLSTTMYPQMMHPKAMEPDLFRDMYPNAMEPDLFRDMYQRPGMRQNAINYKKLMYPHSNWHSNPDDSGLDDSGLHDSGLDDSGLHDSGLDDSSLDDSCLDCDFGSISECKAMSHDVPHHTEIKTIDHHHRLDHTDLRGSYQPHLIHPIHSHGTYNHDFLHVTDPVTTHPFSTSHHPNLASIPTSRPHNHTAPSTMYHVPY